MRILGIETSCDETAISILEAEEAPGAARGAGGTHPPSTTSGSQGQLPRFKVLTSAILSQIKIHEQYGGVFPMMAKREHAKNLVPLLNKALADTGFLKTETSATKDIALKDPLIEKSFVEKQKTATEILGPKEPTLLESLLAHKQLFTRPDIDLIAVTEGPGLEPALWVGINFARALSAIWNTPVMPINHMEGHIVASLLDEKSHTDWSELRPISYPALALLISGGHTELVYIEGPGIYSIIGKTRDDAVGEAFDKVARLLGLLYPGGPEISRLAEAERGDFPTARDTYTLPRPMLHSKDLDFSFSGLKTAVLYMLKNIPGLTFDIRRQIAREFEDAVTEVLLTKTKEAIISRNITTLIIGGGVIANKKIRGDFEKLAADLSIPLLLPSSTLATDNALMIALAAAWRAHEASLNDDSVHTIQSLKAKGNLSLGT
jgi:N6-L-threonylcarbamoyladenine synthase